MSSRMRIAIDARELGGKPTGVGRYLAEILASWARNATAHEVFLYLEPAGASEALPQSHPFHLSVFGGGSMAGHGLVWETVLLPRRLAEDRIDVFWGPNGACGCRKRGWKCAVTLHDLTFFGDTSWFSGTERFMRRLRCAAAVRLADALIVDSEAARRDLLGRFPSATGRVHVIPLGADHVPECLSPTAPSPERILFLGSILNRRLVGNLVRAVALLACRFPRVSLVVAGENRTHPRTDFKEEARKLGLSERVSFSGYFDESRIAELYEAAGVFCFPSLGEGFGIPILEAQRFGVPVVTLKNSSLEEIGADSVAYARSGSPQALADAIGIILADPAYRAWLVESGRRNARRFLWNRTADEVLKVLETAAAGNCSKKYVQVL